MSLYKRRDEARESWKTASLGIIGVLGTGGLGAAAPSLFGVSAEYAGIKGALSFGFQAIFKGARNVDYIGVGADAFTAPGLDAIISGSFNFSPFAEQNRIQLIGYNKNATHFAIDAGAAFVGGGIGDATKNVLQPLLHNPIQDKIIFFSTQTWINAGTQAANDLINKKYEKK